MNTRLLLSVRGHCLPGHSILLNWKHSCDLLDQGLQAILQDPHLAATEGKSKSYEIIPLGVVVQPSECLDFWYEPVFLSPHRRLGHYGLIFIEGEENHIPFPLEAVPTDI